jgi:hypothetical protein
MLNPLAFVIPSEARDLQSAAKCRSLTSFGVKIYIRYRPLRLRTRIVGVHGIAYFS